MRKPKFVDCGRCESSWCAVHKECANQTAPKGPSAMTEAPLTPLERELCEALEWLVSEYTCNVDSCRIGGFYLDPETEDCVVEARAVIRKAKDRTNG